MISSFDNVKALFEMINSMPKLDNNFCILFIYNSPQTMSDTLHESECIFDEELHMILSSFHRVAENVYAIDGEDSFFKKIIKIKETYKYILVYSMAQNIHGSGRRSLIPLLCDYYKLINIGADFMSCTLGRSKDIMYQILMQHGDIPFPETYYIYRNESVDKILPAITSGKWLLKPNNESSSIGMEVHNFSSMSLCDIKKCLDDYQKVYPVFCVQKFIEGEEVAVPILKICKDYYCPGISQVNFPPGKTYIDYDMVSLETYDYFEYKGSIKKQLLDISVKVAKRLNLTAMSRIDFRIFDNTPYIEDIGANPTLSEHNGVNQLYCDYLQADSWCVYAILVYAALIENSLFKPTLHQSPDNWSNN